MNPREHSVYLPHPEGLVLSVGSCSCGWRYGYDASSFEDARAASYAHVEDEMAADLQAGPESTQ